MSLQITGKVIAYFATETGTGSKGEWKKKSLVIETLDQYPKKIHFEAWNKAADFAEKIQLGQEITVHFNPESREYNGNWYTSLRAWKFETKGQSPEKKSLASSYQNPDEEDLPF